MLEILGEAAAELAIPEITKSGLGRSIDLDIHERGGYLTGVMLLAGADGRLCDLMGCLVTVDPPAGTGSPVDRTWALLPGLISQSTVGPLILNVAATVAWGNWHPPGDRPSRRGRLSRVPPGAGGRWGTVVVAARGRRKGIKCGKCGPEAPLRQA